MPSLFRTGGKDKDFCWFNSVPLIVSGSVVNKFHRLPSDKLIAGNQDMGLVDASIG